MEMRSRKMILATIFLALIFIDTAKANPVNIPTSSLAYFYGTSLTNNPADGENTSGIGDFNCDGYNDIFISAPGWSGGKGRIYTYLGGWPFSGAISLSASMADVAIKGNNSADLLGEAFFVLDVTNDGCDDIVTSANDGTGGQDRLYVIPGHSAWGNARRVLVPLSS